jgi:molybdenum cofactor biosynthesis enzyme MoaA
LKLNKGFGRFLCPKPWEQLLLNPNDYYGPCCDLSFLGKRPTSLADVMNLYNSPEMIEVRQALIKGTALATVCSGCSIAAAGHYIPEGHEGFYRDKSAIATMAPTEIVAGVSSVCNLRCVMCDSHSGPLLKELGRDDLRLLEEIGFDNIDVVTITGGEPFLTPDSIDLLQGLVERDTRNMKIRVITNAQTIDRHLDLVSRLRNLHLTISIDGVGEVYERVRQRARWNRLILNLRALKKVRDGHRNMLISINTVVMRSTLPCMKDMVDLAVWLNARVDFQLVRQGSSDDEEILGGVSRGEVHAAIDATLAQIHRRGVELGRHKRDMCQNLEGIRRCVDDWWSPFYASL